ncbi:ABC transporter permease [Peptoniphilus duerdenii]|uniref:ABC transporter permease n=1 Tax=Peptoniphilus duerdenii TaxID=507750 RepID=UPI00254FE861|nr:ABC transporter permease [Peptoniphilus duerdenii]MDK8276670.1 ABC transporter permease [Peptoniphilus duerdenii]
MKKINYKRRAMLASLGQTAIAVLFGLLVGTIVILISGADPAQVYQEMFNKSFFSSYYFLQTLTRATPIAICAFATAMAWRAGYINIGVEGQMIVGGFSALVVALLVPGPPKLVLVLAIIVGLIAGALYATIAAVLNMKFNVTIVICTLMMNYIADNVVSYFVTFPLRATSGDGFSIQTEAIGDGLKFLRFFKTSTFNIGFIIAVLCMIFLIFISNKTTFGYESKMTGFNKNFAKYGGVNEKKVMLITMGLSGAIAALAGICEIFGVKYRYMSGMFTSTSYAWTGLMAALIANLHPVGIFVSSIFLSGLQVGGQAIQRSADIPLQLSTIIQSAITLFVSVKITYKHIVKRKKIKSNVEEIAEGDDK